MISREVEVDESAFWNWDKNTVEKQTIFFSQNSNSRRALDSKSFVANDNGVDANGDDDLDLDSPPIKTKSLYEIYES